MRLHRRIVRRLSARSGIRLGLVRLRRGHFRWELREILGRGAFGPLWGQSFAAGENRRDVLRLAQGMFR